VLQHANVRGRIGRWLERRPRGGDDPRGDRGRAAAAATARRWGSGGCAWSVGGGAAAFAAVAGGRRPPRRAPADGGGDDGASVGLGCARVVGSGRGGGSCGGRGGLTTRGFRIMIRIKHRSVSSGILLAATSYVHQSFHEEPEHEVSFPAVSSVLLSHWMARRFQRIYPDISGYIPDSAEKTGILKGTADDHRGDGGRAAAASTARRWGSGGCAWSVRGGAATCAAVARG